MSPDSQDPEGPIAAVHESASVKVLGRLHDYAMDERRRQASEKRQGTKSREVSTVSARGYGELASRHTGAIVEFGERSWLGMVLGAVRKAGKRVEGLLDVCFGGGLRGDKASGIAAGRRAM